MEKNLKNYKKMLQEQGCFYTDESQAKMLLKYIDNSPQTVYDPTCGQGNLLKVFPDEVVKYGQELDPAELKKAEENIFNFHGYAGDTLKDDGFKELKFDAIVGNYPFSQKWEPDFFKDDIRFKDCPCLPPKSKADFAYILHMIHHLKDNGVCVTIGFPGICYRGNSEGKIRKWLIEQNFIERVVLVEGGHFVDTAISTVILVIRKDKKTKDIIFEDHEKGLERTVSFEEVEQQNFTLSVNSYVQEEVKKEEVDLVALNKKCRNLSALNFLKSMKFDLMIAELDGDYETATILKERVKIVEQWL